jgi:hypothetical protein
MPIFFRSICLENQYLTRAGAAYRRNTNPPVPQDPAQPLLSGQRPDAEKADTESHGDSVTGIPGNGKAGGRAVQS